MTPTPQLSLGLLLTAAAGCVDVVGFIELGGHYTSFMSGNTTQLGDALAHGVWPVVAITAGLILLFFIGSVAGSLLAAAIGQRWGSAAVTALVLASLGVALGLSLGGWPAAQAMLALAAGAGAQNAILPSTGSVRLGATFVTGTLFLAGRDLAEAMLGTAPGWRWVQHLLVWISLLTGGLVGAIGYGWTGITILLLPSAVYLGFLVAFVLWRPATLVP